MNILNAPIRTYADRREILQRIYTALVMADDCRIATPGLYKDLTDNQMDNWAARQTIVRLMRGGTDE